MDEGKIQEVLAMFDGNIPINNIAGELGISNQTIRRILQDHGRDTKRRPAHNDVDEDDVVQMYIDNQPASLIIAKYHISYTALYKILKAHNVEVRKVSDRAINDIRLDRAVEMYVAGAPLWSIKDETGIAQPTLHAALHKRNVAFRRPRMI